MPVAAGQRIVKFHVDESVYDMARERLVAYKLMAGQKSKGREPSFVKTLLTQFAAGMLVPVKTLSTDEHGASKEVPVIVDDKTPIDPVVKPKVKHVSSEVVGRLMTNRDWLTIVKPYLGADVERLLLEADFVDGYCILSAMIDIYKRGYQDGIQSQE